MKHAFAALLERELRLAARRPIDSLLPVAFFTAAASLFPFGIGAEPQILRQIAPGVLWVCALLAAMLGATQLYAGDLADGSLEQMLLAADARMAVVAAKATAHWIVTGLPLTLIALPLGMLFNLEPATLMALAASLLLGTPVLSLLGGLGAALTLGVRNAGVLLIVLVVPLCVPALIFGCGAVGAVDAGVAARAYFSLLGALLIVTALFAPPATAAALRIAVE